MSTVVLAGQERVEVAVGVEIAQSTATPELSVSLVPMLVKTPSPSFRCNQETVPGSVIPVIRMSRSPSLS
jgi:hypothetical protein